MVFVKMSGEHRGAGAVAIPPLGQHTRTVVTEAMPARFVDEVGAHIASALAVAAVKGLVRTLRTLLGLQAPSRGQSKGVLR